MKRAAGVGLSLAAAVVAQVFLGWWALGVVGFVFGFFGRNLAWPATTFGAGVASVGAGRLLWLAWSGAPVADLHQMLAEVTSLPVLTLALTLPALGGLAAAWLGAAVGRRLLFT